MATSESRALDGPMFRHEGYGAHTDGSTVVWINEAIWATPTREIKPKLLVPAIESIRFVDAQVSGDFVVWSAYREDCTTRCDADILGFNLVTGEGIDIDVSEQDSTRPSISGTLVIWMAVSPEGQPVILARDLASMDEPFVVHETETAALFPTISGDRVAWGELDSNNPASFHVFTMRIGEQQPTLLDTQPAVGAGLFGLDLSGDLLVYSCNWELVIHDLSTGEKISHRFPNEVYWPTTDSRYVFWEAFEHDDERDEIESNIQGFDIQTSSLFTVVADENWNSQPDISDGYLVWQGELNEIFGAAVSDVLPSSMRSASGMDGPGWRFYPETGHYLSHAFKAFWETNGGLPVFGYPLTEEFQQQDADTGEFHTVQYVERQRFEWHPENAGTSYEVLLGRLGVEAAARSGLLTSDPFQPRPPQEVIPSHCQSFSETTHLVCLPFADYWSSHGLDLGDPGTSVRESLALFGYPISKAFIEPESGLLVQYFERAVFEYHADNAEPYQVLLRRLGADVLERQNW